MTDEWGPWTEHNGKGCPVPAGNRVQVDVYAAHCVIIGHGFRIEFTTSSRNADWVGWNERVQYRIRKPRALLDLIEMVENLPAPVGPKENA